MGSKTLIKSFTTIQKDNRNVPLASWYIILCRYICMVPSAGSKYSSSTKASIPPLYDESLPLSPSCTHPNEIIKTFKCESAINFLLLELEARTRRGEIKRWNLLFLHKHMNYVLIWCIDSNRMLLSQAEPHRT